jgi:hypothetical protein
VESPVAKTTKVRITFKWCSSILWVVAWSIPGSQQQLNHLHLSNSLAFLCDLSSHLQVDAHQTLRHPPLPLATLALQKEAITHLRMPGEHMMKIAEELYQEGFISYPRTETDCFDKAYDLQVVLACPYQRVRTSLVLVQKWEWPHDLRNPSLAVDQDEVIVPAGAGMGPCVARLAYLYVKCCISCVQALVREHMQDPRWGHHAQRIHSGEQWCPPRSGGHDDKAHPPIHPTR